MNLPATEKVIYERFSNSSNEELKPLVDRWESKSRLVKILRSLIFADADVQRFDYECAREILEKRGALI